LRHKQASSAKTGCHPCQPRVGEHYKGIVIKDGAKVLKKNRIEGRKTPPAGIANAARGNDKRRTRGLQSPQAAFSISLCRVWKEGVFGAETQKQ
jgi:hypothetical protein